MSTLRVNTVQNSAGTGPTKLDLTPSFSAQANAAQGINNAVAMAVSLPAENFDLTNAFNTTNNRFTPQVAGYYQINFGINFAALASGCMALLYKNGTSYVRGTQGGSASIGSCGSTLVYLNGSSDYLELYAYQSSGAGVNLSGNNDTFMNGILVVRT